MNELSKIEQHSYFFTSERESSELNKETFRHYKRMISFKKLPKSIKFLLLLTCYFDVQSQ